MFPLPLAASGLSVAIALKELLISLRLNCGTELLEPSEELLLLEPPLLPQAATMTTAPTAAAVSPTRFVTGNNEIHLACWLAEVPPLEQAASATSAATHAAAASTRSLDGQISWNEPSQ